MKRNKRVNSFKSIIKNATTSVRSSSHVRNYKPTNYIHHNSHYEILIIKKGGGVHSIDFNEYPVVDNQIFFLRPGQMHKFSPASDAEFYFVAINQNEIELNSNILLSQFDFFKSFNSLGYVLLDSVDDLINVVKTIQFQLTPLNKKLAHQDIVVSSYIVVLLIQIQRCYSEFKKKLKIKTVYSSVVVEFNKLIEDNSISKRFVKDYAKLLFVSSNYLNERVKLETGKPASYWINNSLIIQLKKILIQTTKSLKEIAVEFGFTSSTHLVRFFKTNQAITPQVFRKKFTF